MKWSAYLIIGMIFLEACSGGGGGSSSQGVSGVIISPRPLAVQKGNNTIQFTTKDLSGQFIPHSSLTWSVDGTAINGSVDSNGLYTAPASILPQNPVTLRAVLASDPSKNDAVSFYVLTGPAINFNSPFEVTDFNQQGNPVSFHIAVFKQNTYVTWATTSATGGTTGLWYSKGDSDGNFSRPHNILADLDPAYFNMATLFSTTVENPVIVLDNVIDAGDPGVYIAWDDNSTGVYRVNLVKGLNSGGCPYNNIPTPCFTPFALTGTGNATSLQVFPEAFPGSPSGQQTPSLTMTPFGKLEFAWTEDYQGTPNSRLITYGELDSNGFLTNGPMKVTPSRIPNLQINPAIGLDISANVSISWIDYGGAVPNIFYSRLPAGNPNFDPEIQVETAALSPTATFSMALDNSGQPHLVWSKTSVLNETTGIYYSTYDSTLANFISPVKLTIDGAKGYNPTIKVDLLNYLYLSWEDGTSIFFTKTDAPPASGLFANPQWQISGVNPVMNIDDGGRVYLLYSTTGGSNPSTYYVKGD